MCYQEDRPPIAGAGGDDTIFSKVPWRASRFGRRAGHDPPGLRVQITDEVTIVTFEGTTTLLDVDLVREVSDRLSGLCEAGRQTRLLINFAGIEFVSGLVLGKLLALRKRIEQAGGRLRLCGLCPHVRVLFQITRLDQLFDIDLDEAQALASLVKPLVPGPDSGDLGRRSKA